MSAKPNQKIAAAAISIKPINKVPISIEFFNGDKYIASDGIEYPGYSPVVVGSISKNPDDENYIDDETWEALAYDAYHAVDSYVNKGMTVLGMFNDVPNFSNIPVFTKDQMMKAIAAKVEQSLFTNPSNAEIRVTLTQNSGGRTTNIPARENFNPSDLLNQTVRSFIDGSNIFEIIADSFQAITMDSNDYYTKAEVDALFDNEKMPIENLFTIDPADWEPSNPGDGVNKKYVDGGVNEIWEAINKLVVGDIKVYTDKIAIKDAQNETISGVSTNQKEANIEFKAAINKNKIDSSFSDGTLPRVIDLTKSASGNTELRSGGAAYIFDTDGYFIPDAGVITSHIIFDDTDKDKMSELNFEAQDGGKVKANNIAIWDANETTYNLGELVVKESGGAITLGGVRRTTWPSGGGTGGGVTVSSELADDSSSKPLDGINSWKGQIDNKLNSLDLESNGSLYFANKLNYDGNGKSKLNFYATNEGGKEEIRVQYDQTPIMNIERTADGSSLVEMLNGQINKVVDSISETHLVNRKESKQIASDLIANAGLGQWKTTYNKYTDSLKPKTTADGINDGYTFVGDSSGLDRYEQIGHQAGWVSIPDGVLDMWYADTKKPFYEVSLVANFNAIFGEELWEKDTILITPNDIGEEDRYETFKVRVEARDNKGLLFDKDTYYIDVPYYFNINPTTNKLELELGLNAVYTKETRTAKDDNKPTITYGSFDITTDLDVRVLSLEQLDVANINIDDYYTKTETDEKLNDLIEKEFIDSKGIFITLNYIEQPFYSEIRLSSNSSKTSHLAVGYDKTTGEGYAVLGGSYNKTRQDGIVAREELNTKIKLLAKELGVSPERIEELFPEEKE